MPVTTPAKPASPKELHRTGKGGRPPKAREGQISDAILDRACEMFAGRGYAATSVEQLAITCRVGKDTIYRRFPSKRALFEAAIERLRVRVLQRLETVASEKGTGIERLRRAARWFLAVNVEPELVALRRIALSESLLVDVRQSASSSDPIFGRLVSIVRDAQLEGAIVAGEPEFIAGQLIHAVATGPSNETMLGSTAYAETSVQDAFFEKAWTLFGQGCVPRAFEAHPDALASSHVQVDRGRARPGSLPSGD